MEMAHDSAFLHDLDCLPFGFSRLSNFSLMETIQVLLVAAAAVFAVRALYLKYFKAKDGNCGPDCGCH
jgi:hypothetical protein